MKVPPGPYPIKVNFGCALASVKVSNIEQQVEVFSNHALRLQAEYLQPSKCVYEFFCNEIPATINFFVAAVKKELEAVEIVGGSKNARVWKGSHQLPEADGGSMAEPPTLMQFLQLFFKLSIFKHILVKISA